eukprot:scaffold699_cov385-Prasinococcus_capsulatus_cf.AAC.30
MRRGWAEGTGLTGRGLGTKAADAALRGGRPAPQRRPAWRRCLRAQSCAPAQPLPRTRRPPHAAGGREASRSLPPRCAASAAPARTHPRTHASTHTHTHTHTCKPRDDDASGHLAPRGALFPAPSGAAEAPAGSSGTTGEGRGAGGQARAPLRRGGAWSRPSGPRGRQKGAKRGPKGRKGGAWRSRPPGPPGGRPWAGVAPAACAPMLCGRPRGPEGVLPFSAPLGPRRGTASPVGGAQRADRAAGGAEKEGNRALFALLGGAAAALRVARPPGQGSLGPGPHRGGEPLSALHRAASLNRRLAAVVGAPPQPPPPPTVQARRPLARGSLAWRCRARAESKSAPWESAQTARKGLEGAIGAPETAPWGGECRTPGEGHCSASVVPKNLGL